MAGKHKVPVKGENAVTRIYGTFFQTRQTLIGKSLPLPTRKIKERSQAKSHQHTNANALQKSKNKFRVFGGRIKTATEKNSNINVSLGPLPRKKNSNRRQNHMFCFFAFFRFFLKRPPFQFNHFALTSRCFRFEIQFSINILFLGCLTSIQEAAAPHVWNAVALPWQLPDR